MKNLIGISGKMQSGKDTVGKIIQYLTCKNMDKDSHWSQADFFGDNFHAAKWLSLNSDYQIMKFADSLKDMVCILLNCTREQLEDKEFKEKELGEEWDKYYIFGGNAVDKETIIEKYMEEYSILPSEYWLNSKRLPLTPRLLLQLLGTECGRQIIHPNIWVNALFSKYKPFIKNYSNLIKSNGKDLIEGNTYSMVKTVNPKWIITDVRFPNEADAIRERGGIIIRVNRKHGYNTPDGKWKEMPINYHESETALDNYNFDYVIENHKTIKELEEEVKEVYNKIKIL